MVTSYGYDGLGRVSSINNNLSGTAYDVTYGFSYNPASQIVTQTTNNTIFDTNTTAAPADNRAYNGLNQDAAIAALVGGYDAAGNLANEGGVNAQGFGGRVMVYDVYNRLISVANNATPTAPFLKLDYDPEGRLYKSTSNGVVTQYRYDGTKLIGEYDATGAQLRRYIHGPGVDEPVMWYEGSQANETKRYFVQNYQGSIIGYTDAAGALSTSNIYAYGPYGEPFTKNAATGALTPSWSGARFRYTGQTLLGDAKLYY